MKERINLRGLRQCLRNFDADGSYGQYGSTWQIARGGYDLDWELYYNRTPIMDCISGCN